MHRIALIEDNPAEVLLLRIGLDRCGMDYEITAFGCGEKALQFLAASTQPPHLIVTDALMPGFDIDEFLARLKCVPHLAKIPVVVMSGMTDALFIERALSRGAREYIVKPPDLAGWLSVGQRLREMAQNALPD